MIRRVWRAKKLILCSHKWQEKQSVMMEDAKYHSSITTDCFSWYLFIYSMCYIRHFFQHFDIKIDILFYINNCPKRCNTKQSTYYSASLLYMFRVSTTLSIMSTQNCNYNPRYCAAPSFERGQAAWPRWKEVAAQKMWPVPEVVVTVLCTPDDGCGWHTKHAEWTFRIINRLLYVASHWTIINIDQRCTEAWT